MKILFAVDGSTYTKRMLAFAGAHDELFGARHAYAFITVLPPLPPRVASFIDRGALDEYRADEAAKVLRPVLEYAHQQGWSAQTLAPVGHAAEAIAAAAAGFDLLVMGSHGHSALAGAVLGSVVAGVLARCKTPLLIVR